MNISTRGKTVLYQTAPVLLETIIDNKDPTLPPFHAFIKEIEHRNVYIKVKIRDYARRKVFCVSFHYARYPIQSMPYAT